MPNNQYRPLADELRPTELDEVVGQGHILGPDGLLTGEAAAERYRWLVEEYRVAVFAQSLGTAVPASRQRLDRLWAEVVG